MAGANLGTLMVHIAGEFSGLTASIKGATAQINNFAASIAKTSGGRINKAIGTHKQMATSVENLGSATKTTTVITEKGAKTIVSSANAMGAGIQKGAQRGIMGMLSLQSFVKKIVHYITFSIGVQMVMMVRQGIMNMIDIFKRFEESIVNAAAVSGYLGESFDTAVNSISKLTKELSSKTIFTATQVAEAMYTIASAGIDPVTTSTEELLPILNYATATQTDLADATKSVITVLKQFKLGLEDTAMVTDIFTTSITNSFMTAEKMADGFQYVGQIAGELNQDLREVTSSLTLLADRGYTGGQAGQRLNMIFTKLINPTEKAKKMLAELGISLGDIDPTTHNLVDILHKLKNAQFSVGNSSEMFRARTAAAAATLVNAVDEIEEYVILSKEMEGITESIAKRQMETLSSSFKKVRGDAEELSIAIGDNLGPVLVSALESIGGALVALEAPFQSFFGIVGGYFDTLGEWKIIGGTLVRTEDVWRLKNLSWSMNEFTKVGEDGKTVFERFSKEIGKSFPAIRNLMSILGEDISGKIGLPDYSKHEGALQAYSTALGDVIKVRMQLSKFTTEDMKNSKEYTKLQLKLVDANIAFDNAENELITTSGNMLNILRNIDVEHANTIDAYLNLYKAESKETSLTKTRDNLIEEQLGLEKELNNIMSIRGSDSKEYINTLNRYNSVSRQLESTESDLEGAIVKSAEAEKLYNQLFDATIGITTENVETATKLIDLRGDLFRSQSDHNASLIEYNRLNDLLINKEKYKAEAMLAIYDLDDKLLEIELDRYKLAENKKKLDDELFEQLAEQGLLTEEIIEEYKEWKVAEGDLSKARVAYARGEISEAQLQGYIKAAADEQDEYSKLVMKTADHYIDIGIASNDVAESVSKIKDQSNDLEQSAEDYKVTTMELDEAWDNVNRIVDTNKQSVSDAWGEVVKYKSEITNLIDEMEKIPTEIQTTLKITTEVETPTDYSRYPSLGYGESGWDLSNLTGGKLPTAMENWIKDSENKIDRIFDDFRKNAGSWTKGAKGFITSGPQMGLIGESGTEAVIPLEGANRKYGRNLLEYILPKYYPEMAKFQRGGVVGGGGSSSGDTFNETFGIYGPVNVVSNNPSDFVNQLKYKYRTNMR